VADKLNGAACARAGECQSGNCVDGFCCDSPCTGVCQACSNARTGRPNGECRAVTAGTDPDEDCAAESPSSCGTNGLCSGAASCALYPSGTACGSTTCSNNEQTGFACNGSGACQSSSVTQCAPYFCQGSTCGTTCATDASCAASHHCSGASKCDADLPNGTACTRNSMCVSGFCVDGVCCDQACDTPCRACSAAKKGAGANGVCAAVVTGTDPDNDCPADPVTTCDRTGSCDGTGKCEVYPRQTQCGAAVCSGTTLTGRQCDGLGGCQDGQTSSCGAYRCNATGSACLDACSSAADCIPSAFCSGLACVPKKAVGDTCSGASECSSGFCVDSVCCDSKCDGLCQACAAPVKASGAENGKCDFAKAALDPHDSCTDDGAPSCDQDGTCDGSGGCARYSMGAPCGATSCVNNAVTGYTCDGAGTCLGGTSVSCGEYLCAQGACRDGCTAETAVDDCAPGAFCQDAQCRPKKAAGESCSAAAECASGFCTDGVCCNGLCSGQCEACDVVGAQGTCTPVVGAPHGSREPCSVDDAGNPCSARICDGDTRTTCGGFIGTERGCREPSCSDGVAVLPATCNGKGACPEAQRAECGKYACAGTACGKAPCSSNVDCSPGFRCDEGLRDCVPLDSAVCEKDGRTLRSPDGTIKDCKPYVCEADKCKEACTSSTDCLAGHVCDSASKNCIATGKGGAAEEDSGCGCRLPGRSGSPRAPLALALVLIGVGVLRRRRGSARLTGAR
jgi:hypothetical protein